MKKQNLLFLLLTTFTMTITSCGNGEPSYKPDVVDTEVSMVSMLNPEKSGYEIPVHYEDDYFMSAANEYNKGISELSFAASTITDSKNKGEAFFDDLKFSDFEAMYYDVAPNIDTIGYFLAHKTIYNFELYSIIFRGFDYGSEWANNFMIGKTGDHEGFSARAKEVLAKLQTYVSKTNKNNLNVKLWISGYSRGGALANTLSSLILRDDVFEATKEDRLYTYTFESPNCLAEENAIPYPNVHNIINKNDLIASIPPTLYGLKKCGVEHQIYDENVSTIVHSFDSSLVVPEFVPVGVADPALASDEELVNYILNSVFNKVDEEGQDVNEYTANNREQYTDRYQAGLTYLLDLLFKLKSYTLHTMLNDLTNMNYFEIIGMLGDESGVTLANFLKTYLDRDQVQYVESILVSSCVTLIHGIAYLFMQVLAIYLLEDYRPSLIRLLDMHYSEVTYALLIESHQ